MFGRVGEPAPVKSGVVSPPPLRALSPPVPWTPPASAPDLGRYVARAAARDPSSGPYVCSGAAPLQRYQKLLDDLTPYIAVRWVMFGKCVPAGGTLSMSSRQSIRSCSAFFGCPVPRIFRFPVAAFFSSSLCRIIYSAKPVSFRVYSP